jgi:acetyl-CoA C-acetyltransferase
MSRHCAVVGMGQTRHAAKRGDLSMVGLVREAALAALEDAGLDWKDVEALVIGKAPDMFEGVMQPELYLAAALGAVGKPMIRVHTAGSVGGSTAIVAAHLVQSGQFSRVLTVAFEKQSESEATWAITPKIPFQPPLVAGAGGYFAPIIRSYIQRSKAPADIGLRVAVKDRQNAIRNPLAHLHLPDIDMETVANSPLLWDPLHYLECCPSSDGACAMVLADESAAKKAPKKPAWVLGTAMRSEPTMFPGRDQINPRAGRECAAAVYRQAGISDPRKEIDTAEIYVPFSWYEPMWMENLGFADLNEGWKITLNGDTSFTGRFPVNPSGGVLSSNPIGASGMIRFAEAAMQVCGRAGEHQVDGAKIAMGHAYGGGSQFYSMWMVGAEKP